ncbi:MAG: sigma-54-dependent Fis family transcriptional regulator [Bdellovibrionales bacterium]|nr:sigma-54-dependent Fis family transcriptional regulator [Bdellovibrionales bacterium]
MSYRILIVDDDTLILDTNRVLLEERGYLVDTATTADEALKFTRAHGTKYAVAIVDYSMPGDRLNGAELVKEMLEISPELAAYIYSGDKTRDSLKTTWAAGAYGFIEKDMEDELFAVIERQCRKFEETTRLLEASTQNGDENQKALAAVGMVGKSDSMTKVAHMIRKYRDMPESIMILGETGVGKELVARGLHGTSTKPFVAVNCAAWAGKAETADSELFGHEKGSFTGADSSKIGLFESVRSGTLFLDEVHQLGLKTQAGLLRAIQEKKIRRFGGLAEYAVDFRLVVATKTNIKELVDRGEFLPDLYYRMKVLSIEIPPLCERIEDIPLLIQHFTEVFNSKHKTSKNFRMKTVHQMMRYSWPGNIRELGNAVIELLAKCPGKYVEPQQLGDRFFVDDATLSWNALMDKQYRERRERLTRALQIPTKTLAASSLGLSKSTFHSLTKQHKLFGFGSEKIEDEGE